MSDKIQTMSNFLHSGVPKVTIQRVLLETGATENKTIKDPHFVTPDRFVQQPKTQWQIVGDTILKKLKVTLTLSFQGLKKKNLKNDPLKNIFNNLNAMSLVKTKVYEFNSESLGFIKAATDMVNLLASFDGAEGLGNDISFQELTQMAEQWPQEFNVKEFNLLEEMTSATNGEVDLSRYENTLSDGSIVYNFPIRISPYVYTDRDPKFLAYMTVTEIDSSLLLNHIKVSIGGNSDFDLPTEVEQYIATLNSEISNKSVSFDVVFNQGDLNNIGSLFQRTDNKEFWFGSYHSMGDGSYMTGNKHNDLTLDPKDRNVLLETVLLPNTKIIDLRDDEEIEKVFLKELYQLENINNTMSNVGNTKNNNNDYKSERPEKFSISYKSVDSTGAPSYLFGIDKLKILINNSLMAGIAQNLKTAFFTGVGNDAGQIFVNSMKAGTLIKEVLAESKIKDLKILRKRIQTNNFGTNRLGVAKAKQESFMNLVLDADTLNSYSDSPQVQVASYSKDLKRDNNAYLSLGIEKLNGFNFLNTNLSEEQYLFFSFKDTALPAFKVGNYEYSYELLLEDGILKILTNKLQLLMNRQGMINSYVNLINGNLKLYYDEVRDKFNADAISNTSFDDIGNIINDVLQTMEEIILLFNLAANTDPIVDKLYKISNPMFGNYQGLLKFVSTYETFIEKLQKISGLNTSILKHVDQSTSLQKNYGEPKNTIKVNESFLDVASLDDRRAGYDYVLTSFANIANSVASNATVRQVPIETFISMADSQFKRFFTEDDSNSSFVGNINNQNKVRYFTPTIVQIPGRTYSNAAGPTPALSAPLPWHKNFDYYKPIILDILDYYTSKEVEKTSSQETKNNLRRLINIASKYGIIFSGDLFDQLGFLSGPEQGPQQLTSQNTNISGISFQIEENHAANYADMSLVTDLNPNIENFLFGMLSNIILKEEKKLRSVYHGSPAPVPAAVGSIELEGTISQLPVPLQALFVEFNFKLSNLKQYLLGEGTIPFDVIKECPINLSTFGWWWLNYSNIVEVRFIKSYDSLMNPVWAPLTTQELNNTVGNGKKIICKLFKYENRELGVTNKNKFLDLPILNEYFIINPVELVLPADPLLLSEALKTKQNLDMLVVHLGTDFNSVLNLDSRVAKSGAAKQLGSKIDQLSIQEEVKDVDIGTKSGIKVNQDNLTKKLSDFSKGSGGSAGPGGYGL